MMDWQLSKTDVALLVISAVAVGASLYFLFGLRPKSVGSSDREQAGQIVYLTNEVKLRIPDSLIWSGIQERENLSFGDSVYTGEQSNATVQFLSGGTLTIEPSSLVVIEKLNDQLRFDLQSGGALINLAANQSVQMVALGQTIPITSGGSDAKIRIQRAGKDSVNIMPVKGEVKVSTNKGMQKLVQGDELRASSTEAVKKHATVQLLSPQMDELLWTKPGEKINLAWSDEAKGGTYHVVVSRLNDDSAAIFDQKTSGTSATFIATSDGTLTWQVERTDSKASEVNGTFFLNLKTPPEVIFPKDGFVLNKKDSITPIRFAWQPNENADDYLLQITDTPTFKTRLTDTRTKKDFFEFSIAGHVKTYWRVCYEATNPLSGLCSQPRTIEIKSDEPVANVITAAPVAPVAAPVAAPPAAAPAAATPAIEAEETAEKEPPPPPQKPKPETKIALTPPNVKDQKFTMQGDSEGKLKQAPTLSWSSTKGAKKYQVLLAKTRDFENPISKQSVATNKFLWNDVEPGKYFVRVKATANDFSADSNVATLDVSTEPPKLSPQQISESVTKPQMVKEPSEVNVQWPPLPKVSRYRVQKASDPKSGSWKESDVDQPSAKVLVTPGKPTFVRVQSLDSDSKPSSDFSSPVEIKVVKQLKMSTPEIVQPQEGVKVVSFGINTNPILFLWKESKYATSYELQIAGNTDFNNIIKSVSSKETSYALTNVPDLSKIYWRIRAKRKEGFSDWAGPFLIEIDKK